MEKAREFQKNIYFCFIDYVQAFDYVGHHRLWKILKDTGIQDHLTCLLQLLVGWLSAISHPPGLVAALLSALPLSS